jgi:HD superfamily phosphohydrolase YqeK
MIVYLADLLEPTRDFKGIKELREVAKTGFGTGHAESYGTYDAVSAYL